MAAASSSLLSDTAARYEVAPRQPRNAADNAFLNMLRISPTNMVDVVNRGVGTRVIEDASAFYQVSKGEFLELVGISAASESRWKKADRPLPRAESDRVARIVRVTAFAATMLGDQTEARDWLVRKIPALGGRTPLSYLGTDAGSKVVEDTLVRSIAGVVA